MRIAVHIDGGALTARLHLTDDEKKVLRENRNLLGRVVHDRTPRNFEQQRQHAQDQFWQLSEDLNEATWAHDRQKKTVKEESGGLFFTRSMRRDPKIQASGRRVDQALARSAAHTIPEFDPSWVVTIEQFLGQDVTILFANLSEAKKAQEDIEKRIAQLTKEIATYIPEPEPEPPEPEPEPIAPPDHDLRDRFRGHWVVGTQGTGKTQLFQYMIARDLDLVAERKASLIILDPTGKEEGSLIHTITSLKRFVPGGDLHGKLVIIDPSERDFTLPINLLSLRSDANDDDALSAAIENYLSVMGGLMGQPLTGFQDPVFRHVVQLAMVMPNANLATLRRIIQPISARERDKEPWYEEYLDRLHPDVRDYFTYVYNSDGANRSRGEIMNRLFTLTSDPVFRRLFSHDETRIDFYEQMNSGKVIVINAARDTLRGLTKLYGRFFIALITEAGKRRASLPRGTPLPCFIYIDECDEFVKDDPNAATILEKLRQMNIGLIFGNQRVNQIDDAIQESFMTTGIKYANCNEASAKALAPEMGQCRYPLLMTRPWGNFMASVGGREPFPIQVEYQFVENRLPHMTEAEMMHVRGEIIGEYYVPTRRVEQTEPIPKATTEPDEPDPPEPPKRRRSMGTL